MSVSSQTKVHSSMSSRSSLASGSSAFLGDGFGEKGVDDAIERCRARVLAYSRSRYMAWMAVPTPSSCKKVLAKIHLQIAEVKLTLRICAPKSRALTIIRSL